jgi:hypothetical protein
MISLGFGHKNLIIIVLVFKLTREEVLEGLKVLIEVNDFIDWEIVQRVSPIRNS